MDALLAAGIEARVARDEPATTPVRVILVPTAVARHRPEMAVAQGRRAFEAAGRRAGVPVAVEAAMLLDRVSAKDGGGPADIGNAHVIHLPGGDPDLLPAVLRGTRAWAAMLRAHAAGACIGGASAGAMALAERCWTPSGTVAGLGLVPGIAVLPHFDPRRAGAWRHAVDPAGELSWVGLDERTLVIGRPGGEWRVAGRGRAHLLPPGSSSATISAHAGELLPIP
jgi:cyanophycinase